MKLYKEGLMGGDNEIAEYENGGTPWCITYTFMPDELEDILRTYGVKNIKLASFNPPLLCSKKIVRGE